MQISAKTVTAISIAGFVVSLAVLIGAGVFFGIAAHEEASTYKPALTPCECSAIQNQGK